MKRYAGLSFLMVALLMSLGCGEDADHQAVQQAVSSSADGAADTMIDAIAMLESSKLWSEHAAGDCDSTAPDSTDDGYCDAYSTAPESGEMDAMYGELRQLLQERIFHSDNIEDSSGGTVTYLIRGEVVCHPDEFYSSEGHEACVQEVDALEIRLRANVQSDERVEIDILLGPDRIHPLSTVFASDELSMTAVLDAIEPAAQYLANTFGEEFEGFAERLEGEVKFGYYDDGELARFALDIPVDLGIEVAGDERFSLDMEGVGEVASMGVNTAAQTLVGSVSMGAMGLEMTTYDEWAEPGAESHDIAVTMAGLSSQVVFDPESERIEWSDVGLGDGPASLHIDGEEVLSVALNVGLGGLFDAVLEADDDFLDLSVEPGLELQIGTFYHHVADSFDDYDEWMLDEVLEIVLGGDDNPAIRLREEGIEVLRGHLSLSSDATDFGADVQAGMCLVEQDSASSDTWDHPFEFIEQGQCIDG